MYKVKETQSVLEVRSKTAVGFVWTGLFLIISIVSFYMGFEYISIKSERTLREVVNVSSITSTPKEKRKLSSKKGQSTITEKSTHSLCHITYFNFKKGLRRDSIPLTQIIRMDKGYHSSLGNESKSIFHYNPTLITSEQKPYPLRRISDVAFTPEVISQDFNEFILNNSPYILVWDWFMGYWGIAAGISFLGLLFLSVSGRYQIARFDKEKHTFSIKNYGLLGFVGEEGEWKDIKRIIYQDKKTVHKKGIFFLVRRKSTSSSKKFKTQKIYFTHHTDSTSKEVAQKIANLIRPIAKPDSEKNKFIEERI